MNIINKLKSYAEAYKEPPYGIEVQGTSELLEEAASCIEESIEFVQKMRKRYIEGFSVDYEGDDADDDIKCHFCGYSVARNDDYDELKPKHCPQCGTKLIY